MQKIIKMGSVAIGDGQPVFIIAEAGVNHNGNLKLAKQLIDVAAESKADAVKFQTFNPDTLITKDAPRASYQVKNEKKKRKGESQYDMLRRLMLPREYHSELKKYTEEKGLVFMSTPFSLDDAYYLRRLGVEILKVGSTDTENTPYLAEISKWNVPIILSTGMSDLAAVKRSVGTMKKAGCEKLVVLHCTTNYPTPFEQANIRAILTLKKELGLPVGFSDHTPGIEVSIAAVALGACVIEKHFTVDKNLPGPDHAASLDSTELKLLVRSIRNVEKAFGTGIKKPFPVEQEIAKVARKSLIAARLIPAGKKVMPDDIIIKRPGTGMPPKDLTKVIGRIARVDIPKDTLINLQMFK